MSWDEFTSRSVYQPAHARRDAEQKVGGRLLHRNNLDDACRGFLRGAPLKPPLHNRTASCHSGIAEIACSRSTNWALHFGPMNRAVVVWVVLIAVPVILLFVLRRGRKR